MGPNKQEYHKVSNAVVFGGMLSYIGFFVLLISFISPYWLSSYDETFSSFKNMGLWIYCFKEFRFPYYQFDKKFDGCHSIFSDELHPIRQWILPGWMMVVQAFVTIPFLLSLFNLAILAAMVTRFPLKPVLRYEWMLSSIASTSNAIAGLLLFLAVSTFGLSCYRRDWIMYPTFNHLSWSFAFAVVSSALHLLAAFLLHLDAQAGYKLRKESRNLVVQMEPNPRSHHSLHHGGYI